MESCCVFFLIVLLKFLNSDFEDFKLELKVEIKVGI